MRLWDVELSVTVAVIAETRAKAEAAALDSEVIAEEMHNIDAVARLASLDAGDDGSIPWGAPDKHPRRNWTVAQWKDALREEAEEAKRAAEFDAKQVAPPLGGSEDGRMTPRGRLRPAHAPSPGTALTSRREGGSTPPRGTNDTRRRP